MGRWYAKECGGGSDRLLVRKFVYLFKIASTNPTIRVKHSLRAHKRASYSWTALAISKKSFEASRILFYEHGLTSEPIRLSPRVGTITTAGTSKKQPSTNSLTSKPVSPLQKDIAHCACTSSGRNQHVQMPFRLCSFTDGLAVFTNSSRWWTS